MENELSFTPVPLTDPWNRVPFVPYVYRGTGKDQMPWARVYQTDLDYATCKKCRHSYKSPHHKNKCRRKQEK